MATPDDDEPQNRAKTGDLPRDPGTGRFPPGVSGNPGGRPSTKWIRDYMAEALKPGAPARQMAVLQALFATALDRRHKDHVRAAECLVAYIAGKPIQAVEVSAPDPGIDGMTSEQQNARLSQLLAKAAAAAKRASGGPPGAGPSSTAPPPGQDDDGGGSIDV